MSEKSCKTRINLVSFLTFTKENLLNDEVNFLKARALTSFGRGEGGIRKEIPGGG